MLKRLQWVIFPLLALLSASCYGKAEIEAPGVFTCQTNDDCLPEFECRNDPGQLGAGKFCMKRDASQLGGTDVCVDSDGDGFGDATTAGKGFAQCKACANPAFDRHGLDKDKICSGAIRDCNDSTPNVYPGAIDVCDGLDNDCDGVVDNEVPRPCNLVSECAGGASTVTIGSAKYLIACENKVCVLKTLAGKPVQCEGGHYVEKP